MAADRRANLLGVFSAISVVALEALYLAALVSGLAALESPDDPIANPYFTIMELLILAMMVPIVLLAIAIHATCPNERKPFALGGVAFAALLACVTSVVHFSVLTLSRLPEFEDWSLVFAFIWPSAVYSLDILAWDIFFPISVVLSAFAFEKGELQSAIRGTLFLSGALALAGLAGVPLADMQVRNIGIIGYVGVYPVAAFLIAIHFRRRLRSGG